MARAAGVAASPGSQEEMRAIPGSTRAQAHRAIHRFEGDGVAMAPGLSAQMDETMRLARPSDRSGSSCAVTSYDFRPRWVDARAANRTAAECLATAMTRRGGRPAR